MDECEVEVRQSDEGPQEVGLWFEESYRLFRRGWNVWPKECEVQGGYGLTDVEYVHCTKVDRHGIVYEERHEPWEKKYEKNEK